MSTYVGVSELRVYPPNGYFNRKNDDNPVDLWRLVSDKAMHILQICDLCRPPTITQHMDYIQVTLFAAPLVLKFISVLQFCNFHTQPLMSLMRHFTNISPLVRRH